MKALIIIILLLTNSLFKQSGLDVTDIVKNAKVVASRKFTKDANGNTYSKKEWHVYYRFVQDRRLKQILENSLKNRNCSDTIVCNKIRLLTNKLRFDVVIKANETFNFVEFQSPYYNKCNDTYTTLLRIRDKSWTGGFCMLVNYKVINNKCIFKSSYPMIISDLTEY